MILKKRILINGPYVMDPTECRWELVIDAKIVETVKGVGFHEAICMFALRHPEMSSEILACGVNRHNAPALLDKQTLTYEEVSRLYVERIHFDELDPKYLGSQCGCRDCDYKRSRSRVPPEILVLQDEKIHFISDDWRCMCHDCNRKYQYAITYAFASERAKETMREPADMETFFEVSKLLEPPRMEDLNR